MSEDIEAKSKGMAASALDQLIPGISILTANATIALWAHQATFGMDMDEAKGLMGLLWFWCGITVANISLIRLVLTSYKKVTEWRENRDH